MFDSDLMLGEEREGADQTSKGVSSIGVLLLGHRTADQAGCYGMDIPS
jgi:hypothetical protein